MRKYLGDIGVKRKNRPEAWRNGLKRRIKCWFERRVYGFDATETYNLDYSWHLWLYERLKMYRKYATKILDLTEEKFDYNGEKHSLIDLIDMMIKRLEFRLNPKFDYNDYVSCDKQQFEYVHEIEKIWEIVCPAMWW